MLTISNNDKVTINVKKEEIKTLLEGSVLEKYTKVSDPSFLQEENSSGTTYVDFNDILEMLDNKDVDAKKSFDILHSFLKKETVLNDAKIMLEHTNSIKTITEQIDSLTVFGKLMIDLIPNNIPDIIKSLDLTNTYIQLIFYEYFYKSPYLTLADKIKIMCVNKFTRLAKMINEGSLEICTISIECENSDETINKLRLTRSLCYGSNVMMKMFDTLIDDHSEWFGIDIKTCSLSKIFSINLTKEILGTKDNLNKFIVTNNKVNKIDLIDICHINRLYQKRSDELSDAASDNLSVVLSNLVVDFKKLHKIDKDELSLIYESIDLIVRLMEEDHPAIMTIKKDSLHRLFSSWLKMTDGIFPYIDIILDKNNDYQPGKRNIRVINLSNSITSAVDELCLTFNEMNYIFYMDNLEMFKMFTKSLEFRNMHQSLFKYMPPKILDHVIKKHLKTLRTEKSEQKIVINLSPYNLLQRTPKDLSDLMKMLKSLLTSHILIEFDSVINKYNYVDNAYIIMYWDYIELMSNHPKLIESFIAIFDEIDLTTQLIDAGLDIVLLKTAYDNLMNKKNEIKKQIKIDSIVEKISQTKDFYTKGPNLPEILHELETYSVNNLSSITKLKSISESFL